MGVPRLTNLAVTVPPVCEKTFVVLFLPLPPPVFRPICKADVKRVPPLILKVEYSGLLGDTPLLVPRTIPY
jgi:hypothetical protein